MSAPAMTRGRRGGDARGNTIDRARRRAWLLTEFGDGTTAPCFRCGVQLTEETITVDRIVPGRDGGTYVRGNIRPACRADNLELGGRLGRHRPLVIGADPGPVPGLALVRPDGTTGVVQCTAELLEPVLRAVVATAPRVPVGHPETSATFTTACVLAVERYVVGRRSTRVQAQGANAQTRQMAGALEALGHELGVVVRMRAAAEVKPWATANDSARITAAGFAVEGMRHARSAAWHALYAAVHDTGLPDPLSRRPARSPSAGDPR